MQQRLSRTSYQTVRYINNNNNTIYRFRGILFASITCSFSQNNRATPQISFHPLSCATKHLLCSCASTLANSSAMALVIQMHTTSSAGISVCKNAPGMLVAAAQWSSAAPISKGRMIACNDAAGEDAFFHMISCCGLPSAQPQALILPHCFLSRSMRQRIASVTSLFVTSQG